MNLLAGRCISSHIVSSICRRLLDDPAAHNQAMSRRARAPGCCLAAAAKAARSERERRFHGNRQARKGRKSIDGCELHCNNKRPLSPRSLPQSLGFLIRDRKKVKLEFHVCSQFSPSCLWFSPPADTFPNVNLVSRVFHAAPRSAAPVAIVDGSSVRLGVSARQGNQRQEKPGSSPGRSHPGVITRFGISKLQLCLHFRFIFLHFLFIFLS